MNDCIIASLLPPPGWGAPGAFSWNSPVFRVFLWNADEMRSFRHSSNNCSGTAKLALAFSFHRLESSRKTDTKNIFICSLSNQNCWVSHGCSAEELGFLRGRWTCWLTHRRKPSLLQPADPHPEYSPLLWRHLSRHHYTCYISNIAGHLPSRRDNSSRLGLQTKRS